MIEVAPVSIDPIVAGPAIAPKGKHMRAGEDRAHLFVAGLANRLVELGISHAVAIVTAKG